MVMFHGYVKLPDGIFSNVEVSVGQSSGDRPHHLQMQPFSELWHKRPMDYPVAYARRQNK